MVAAILAFLGVGVGWEWLAFVVVSGASLACLYPLRHRLDRSRPAEGIGSRRLIGQPALVLQDIPGGPAELGLVRVGREEWRAESRDGRPLPAGTNARVIDVQGTRVIVWPVDEIASPEEVSWSPSSSSQRSPCCCSSSWRRACASCGRSSAGSWNGSASTRPRPSTRACSIILPFIDTMRLVDMREQVVDVPPQEVITADNVVVSVDAVVYYEATDPQRLVYNVANFFLAITKLAQTNLRNLVGDLELDQALTSRDTINTQSARHPRRRHRQVGRPGRAGGDPAHRPAAGRRARRCTTRCRPSAPGGAVVTEADGRPRGGDRQRRGREGSRRSSRPRAPAAPDPRGRGRAGAIKALADAERYRQLTVAEGRGVGDRRRVYDAIHAGNPTPDLLAIKYLEALQAIANGRATKIFLPADTSSMMGSLAGVAELFKNAGENGNGEDSHAALPPPSATSG